MDRTSPQNGLQDPTGRPVDRTRAHTVRAPHPARAPHRAVRHHSHMLVGDSCATCESLPFLSHFAWQSSCLSTHTGVSVGTTSLETAKAEGFAFPTNTVSRRKQSTRAHLAGEETSLGLVNGERSYSNCSFQPGVIILLLKQQGLCVEVHMWQRGCVLCFIRHNSLTCFTASANTRCPITGGMGMTPPAPKEQSGSRLRTT